MIKQKLQNKVSKLPIDNYYPKPQYENYGNTAKVVAYNYSQEQESKMWEEQKQKLIEEIESGDFLEWEEINKYWERLMENENLLNRVKRILINYVGEL